MEPWLELETLINNRDFKRAEVLIAKRLKSAQTSIDRGPALIYRARLRLLMGRPNEALVDIREADLNASETAGASYLELLADVHFQQYELATVGFSDKADLTIAHESYKGIVQGHPDYENLGWVHYQLGRLLLISADPTASEQQFRAALFQPSHLPTLTAFCYERIAFIALYEQRSYRQALTYIDKAIATYPAQEPRQWLVQALLLRSKIYQYLDLSLALESARNACQLASLRGSGVPKAMTAEAVLAVAELSSRSRGLERDVIEYGQQFIQLSRPPVGIDVTWSRVHELLGDAFTTQGRYEQAISAYQHMLQHNPYHPWDNAVKIQMAQCYYQIANYTRAVELAQQVLTDTDSNEYAAAYELLAYAYHHLNRPLEARQAWQEAVASGIHPEGSAYGSHIFST